MASSVPDAGLDDFCGNWLAFISASARKDERQAASHLERSLMVSRSLTHTIRDSAAQEAAIFSAWFRRDEPLAQKWLNQITRPKLWQPLARFRVEITTRCARGEFEKALRAWDEGFSYVKILPDNPANQILIEGWQEWRKQIEDRQKHPSLVEINEFY